MKSRAYKNYIFDFYGTLVDILTDEKDPVLWDKLGQLYQAYGAAYEGDVLKKAYAKRVDQARKELMELKGVAYPEIDLAHIFNQLYVDARPQSSNSNQPDDWGQFDSHGLSRLISQTCDGLSSYQGGASLSKRAGMSDLSLV